MLLSLGATDVGGVTLPALEAVLAAALEVTVDVVLSSQAPSLPAVRRLAAQRQDVAVHVDQSDMAALLAGADLAVGAAGTSSWERCCLALPTVSLVLADNQRLVAARLADLGAAVAVDSTADITVVVGELAHDRLRRAEMAAAAAAVTDGTGAAVVTDLMIDAATTGSPATGLRVRPVDPNDAERLWLWRNDPQTRAMARTPAVVTWQSHATWFERTLAEGRSRLLMVESADEPVAMVRCDDLDEDEALVSINVAPSARGRGVGGQALALACAEHDRDRPGVALVAEILTSNTASLRIFQTNGFREQAQTSGKFRRFVRPTADLAGG